MPLEWPLGRSKRRCLEKLHQHLNAAGIHPDQSLALSLKESRPDRERWQQQIKSADPATSRVTSEEKEEEEEEKDEEEEKEEEECSRLVSVMIC